MKRILSVLLALVMVIGMLPMSILTASAAEGATYVKVTSAPTDWSGTYLIVYDAGNLAFNGGLTTLDAGQNKISVTITDGSIVANATTNAAAFTIEAVDGGYAIKSASGYYIGNDANSNKLNSNKSTKYVNTITLESDGVKIVGKAGAVLRYNATTGSSNERFRYYKSGTYASQKAISLYKLVEETTEPSEPVETTTACSHVEETVAEVPATCTTAGTTAGVQCSLCGEKISGFETIPATGHSYGEFEVTVAAGCTAAGSQTKTCATCGDKVTEEIPATGHTYVDGVCSVCGVNQADVVSYEKVTVDTVTAGKYIIGAIRDGSYPTIYPATAKTTTTSDGKTDWNVSATSVTAVDDTITGDSLPADAQIITLTGNNEDGFTIGFEVNGEMVYLGFSSAANRQIAFSADYSEVLWTVDALDNGLRLCTEGYFVFQNSQYETAIRGYTTQQNSTSVKGLYLFKEVAGDVVDPEVPTDPTDPVDPSEPVETEPVETEPVETEPVETEPSEPETEPSGEHAGCDIAEVEAKEPTCTEDGNTAGKYCNDCDEYFDGYEVIPATGHNYVNGTCANCGEADPNVGTDENANIVFELGANGDAGHADGSSKTTYTETVGAYTLDITATDKMYTGAFDAKGNSCIKLGTGSVVGGFTIAVPDNVTSVVISVAGYKAKTVTVKVNGESYALTTLSDNGEYTAITVDTRTTKTVKFETTTTGYRAMVNSIEFVVSSGSETGHTCVWDEGTVTTAATCLAEGVMTYNCTVEGCEMYKTEAIAKTGHDMVNGICSVCNAEYYTLSTTLNNNDSVIIYYPTSKVAMSAAASNKGLAAANVTIDESGMLTNSDVAIMQVQYMEGSETDFYLICDGKYLTSAATGNGLSFADSASEYAVWYIEVVEGGNSTVFIHSRNAKYNGSSQSMEFYSGFTTYGTKTTEIYQFQLYTKGENDIACEHSWSEWEIVTAATCTTAGEQKSVCANCGDEKVQTIAATGHTYNFGDEAVTCAACDLNVAKAEIVNVPKTADSNAYYVEGVVTFVDGGTVYIQDATGGVALRLGNDVSAPAIGTKVEAIGNCSVYNGLIQLQEADFEAVSSDNTVEAQEVTLAQLKADTELAYLSEKVSLQTVMVQSIGKYNSTYKNIDYTVSDGTNTIVLYRTPLADEANKLAVGDVINVIGVVGTYNGYQIRVVNENDITKATVKITHISLDAGKDALGFKAELNGIDPAEVTSYGFEFTVNGRTQVFKLDNALNKNDITARIYKIMGSKGGEKIITGRAFVVVNGVEISSESQSTSMKDTIVKVNEIFTTLSETQKAAVYGLYKNYYETMDAWLGETNNIKNWAPAE